MNNTFFYQDTAVRKGASVNVNLSHASKNVCNNVFIKIPVNFQRDFISVMDYVRTFVLLVVCMEVKNLLSTELTEASFGSIAIEF